jgi:hypothetical protein
LSGQALVLVDLALVKLESSDTLKLTHGSGLRTLAFLAGIDALGYQSERPPDLSTRSNDDASIAAPRVARGRADRHDVGLDRSEVQRGAELRRDGFRKFAAPVGWWKSNRTVASSASSSCRTPIYATA